MTADPLRAFWQGRKVLITGHTGFKGSWLSLWLASYGADVMGLALNAPEKSLFRAARLDQLCSSSILDIRDAEGVRRQIQAQQPEFIFHLAAQALVGDSYADPLQTWETNVQGTAHVLDAMRYCKSLKVAVIVTTDKVYENREWAWAYRESDHLGGHDPYSASKAACELLTSSYRRSFLQPAGISVSTVRAGNVIGGGDWSDDRLLPDALRAWQSDQKLVLRRPGAVRPWQHVLDCLYGYLELARQSLDAPDKAGIYNFAPASGYDFNVGELARQFDQDYGGHGISAPTRTDFPHEAGRLRLDASKAEQQLGWRARWSARQAVERAARWYRAHEDGGDARLLCEQDLSDFTQTASAC